MTMCRGLTNPSVGPSASETTFGGVREAETTSQRAEYSLIKEYTLKLFCDP